jgi:YVTN family beta-propeller protein
MNNGEQKMQPTDAGQHKWRGYRVKVAALVAAAGLAIGPLAAIASATNGSENPPPGSSVIATIPVDDAGGQLAVGFDSIWVANPGHDTVSRIDPTTDQVIVTIPVGSGPFGLAAGEGAVWAANQSGNTISRIDPASNTVTATLPVGINPVGIATTPGDVWVANHNGNPSGSVMRIDPATNAVIDTIPVGAQQFCCGPSHMAADAGGVWVGVPNINSVVRISSDTDSIIATIHVGSGVCGDLAASDTAIWVAGGGCAAGISQINPTTNQPVGSNLGAGGRAAGLALGFGSLWFTTLTNEFIGRLNPNSNAVTGLLKAPGTPTAIATGYTSTWVADPELSAVLRLQP